jgi:hypothetical protein
MAAPGWKIKVKVRVRARPKRASVGKTRADADGAGLTSNGSRRRKDCILSAILVGCQRVRLLWVTAGPKQGKTRQDKTRQDKTRQDKTRHGLDICHSRPNKSHVNTTDHGHGQIPAPLIEALMG